jgi:hypothetical protein
VANDGSFRIPQRLQTISSTRASIMTPAIVIAIDKDLLLLEENIGET